MLDPHDFAELAATRSSACVSLYLPTHRRGREVREGPIRLSNLLRDARERAIASGLATRSVTQTLMPLQDLLDDSQFWNHQAEGLALFAADGALRQYPLPYPVDELVTVGQRFNVRWLLPAIDSGQRFFVLMLSQNRVRLLQCSRQAVQDVDLPEMPRSLGDALGHDWEEKSLQFHTVGKRSAGRDDAMFHGQGRGNDESKSEIRRFLQAVDAELRGLLGDSDTPLVLATVGYVASIYRQVSCLPQLLPQGIDGNPDQADTDEVRRQALRIVESQRLDACEQQLARLASIAHTPRATLDLPTVLAAARDARIEVMLVSTGKPVWGTFDPNNGAVDISDHRRANDEDLLDLAVSKSLGTGARVLGAAPDRMPKAAAVAAILRFDA